MKTITGILIVLNNLLADYEGRASDKGRSRLYVAY
jgi:hypothetical protein